MIRTPLPRRFLACVVVASTLVLAACSLKVDVVQPGPDATPTPGAVQPTVISGPATATPVPAPATPSASPAPHLAATPTPLTQFHVSASDEPSTVVLRYYALVTGHSYDAAWALMTPHLQSITSYADWVSGYRDTQSVDVLSLHTQSVVDTRADVAVSLQVADQGTGQVRQSRYTGDWYLSEVGQDWRLDGADVTICDAC